MTAMITHHLTPDLLIAYSAGTLPEAFNLIVASHVSLCDACRAEVASYDALGGSLIEKTDAPALSDSSSNGSVHLHDDRCRQDRAASAADPA